MSVSGDDGAEESPAAGCGFHLVFGGDVVLDEEGDAVEWAADVTSGSFGIKSGGDLEEVRVELNYCAVGSQGMVSGDGCKASTNQATKDLELKKQCCLLDVLICLKDSLQIAHHDRHTRQLPSFHCILQFIYGGFFQNHAIAIRHRKPKGRVLCKIREIIWERVL